MRADTDQDALIAYLAATAKELALVAAQAPDKTRSSAMLAEAEELLAIRARIAHRAAQLELPLDARRAA